MKTIVSGTSCAVFDTEMEVERARMLTENGHSFIITGQCGTGKTHLLRSLIKSSSAYQEVAITATTGMASTELGMGATTLHHWCGIMDCRYSEEKLHELIMNDDKFAMARARIIKTDLLFIDEIGMLSRKVFEMAESVCRFVRESDRVFGGIQIIACGDFKQLSPVPNHWYNDDGSYCFTSPHFKMTFPHHINLKKVVRQTEPDLIAAVNELCDGCPSPTTIAFLRSMDRPLSAHMNPTFLFGTRFDADVINQEMVEEMPGTAISLKSIDEGDKQLLRRCDAPKILILKEGAPVMVTRNIGNGVFNGTRGIVHKLTEDKDPLININGNIISVQRFIFDIYHPQQQKTLAKRSQYPLQLAFALTVHKAQGQTLECVEVDCYSFFAPGQMGVAVGRCVNKDGLRIVNFNLQAANLKHSEEVYAFYSEDCNEPLETLECCRQVCENITSCLPNVTSTIDFTEEAPHDEDEEVQGVLDTPDIDCPWNLEDFIHKHQEFEFLKHIPKEILNVHNESMQHHMKCLYSKVHQVLSKRPEKSESWVAAYSSINQFLLSETHVRLCENLFKSRQLNHHHNKFSTKLLLWLMDSEIKKKASHIVAQQQHKFDESDKTVHDPSSVAQSKIRYLAGACIHKISERIQKSVLRTIGKMSKSSRLGRKISYHKQKLLKQLRISEENTESNDPTMKEILHKQGASRGLFIVNESVYKFFVQANNLLQTYLKPEFINLHICHLQGQCRNLLLGCEELLEAWLNLFQSLQTDDRDEEIFMSLLLDLFAEVVDHFIKLALVDAIREFKELIPRKKKQALRSKITALGERGGQKTTEPVKKGKKYSSAQSSVSHENEPSTSHPDEIYNCDICKEECEWEPSDVAYESIACDKCNNWFHYACVDIKGDEAFLLKKNSRWHCPNCKPAKKGKGKGGKNKYRVL